MVREANAANEKTELETAPMKILVLNSGSSSQKACLYEIGDTLPDHPPVPLWEGKIEWTADTAAVVRCSGL